MQWAVDVLTRTLGVATVYLGRPVGCGRLEVAYAAGSLRAAAGEIITLPQDLARSQTPPADPVRGYAVHLEVDGRPGLLVVLDDEPRRFSDADADLVRMVALLLATAMERDRREAAQALISGFGRLALESADPGVVISRALDVVREATGAPIAALVQMVSAGRIRVVDLRGPVAISAGQELDVPEELLHAGYLTYPHVVDDWAAEPPGALRSTILAVGVRSSIGAGVRAGGRSYRLSVADTVPRRFHRTEVDVVLAVAQLLSETLRRRSNEIARAAVAEFGRFALQSRDIGATIARSVDLVCEVLNVPLGVVTQFLDHGRSALRSYRGAIGFQPDATFEVPTDILATYLHDEPLVVPDWDTETRFERRPVLPPGVRSTISATVLSGARVWGRLVGMDTHPRQFTGAEVDFVQSMANVLAAALERDRIETRLRNTTRQLQHALLPGTLPALEGIEAAVRYVPAGGSEVGGDWYDVLPLPDGGIGVVMGDVEGHDEVAAAIMGQVRNVLRAYASEGHHPAAILNHVNRFVTVHTERLVTCCYAELHPNEGSVTCATAGHAAPLVLDAAGAIWPLPLDPGVMMGVVREHDFVEHTRLLPAAARLLLFTDGVVDDCTAVLHEGPDAFAGAIRTLAGAPLPELADGLVARPADASPLRDDAALLVVRLTAPIADGGSGLHRVWPASPMAPRAARCLVADVLSDWRLAHLSDRAVPAVSELVANVVVHTASRVRLTVRRTAADRVWIGVHDTSDRWPGWSDPGWLDRLTDPTAVAGTDLVEMVVGGRGLAIVAGLVDAWGVVPGGDLGGDLGGKTVWFELTGVERPGESPNPLGAPEPGIDPR